MADLSAPHRFEIVEQIASTNGELLGRLSRGEALCERNWLIANRQGAGRGRLGRPWQDASGNFMGSTVVAIRASDPPPHTLALIAGVAVYDAVAAFLPECGGLMLKWPNDLLLDGAKLAGILLERKGDHVIIGIGVNLASSPDLADRGTISLAALGTPVDRDQFANRLAAALDTELIRWRDNGLADAVARWTQRGPALGTQVAASPAGEGRLTGTYRGLDPQGALLMRLAGVADRAIHAGEVELLRNGED